MDQPRAEEPKLAGKSSELAELFTEGLIDRRALTARTEKADARIEEIRERIAALTVSRVNREALACDSEHLLHLLD